MQNGGVTQLPDLVILCLQTTASLLTLHGTTSGWNVILSDNLFNQPIEVVQCV